MLICALSVQVRDSSSKCFFKETDLNVFGGISDKWCVPSNVKRRMMSSMSSAVIEDSLVSF